MKKIAVISLLLLLLAAGCRRTGAGVPAPTAEVPAPMAEPALPETPAEYAFPFTASTLDGETVTEAVLGQYDLTMVNVWASWCPPCRAELPELAELYGRLPGNVGFLSVTVDDPGDLEDARALLSENGCAFPCLDGQGSEGLMKGFLNGISAIPTTLFLDRNGDEVGRRIVGVPRGSVTDAYLSEIQARLDLLTEK